MIAKKVTFEGRVQGVGFRYTVKQLSLGFDVTGWVKNLKNGNVELVAAGEEEEVAEFIAEIAEESELASLIKEHHAEWIDPPQQCSGFSISH